MPLHIDIRINRELINTLHIARVRGGTDADDINDYLILEGDEPLRYEDWLIDGIPFTHRYGDGAEICVMKGIQSMYGHEGYTTAEVFDAGVDQERTNVIEYLRGRIEDFNVCTKNDTCKDIMYVLEGIVKDIEYGEHLGQNS